MIKPGTLTGCLALVACGSAGSAPEFPTARFANQPAVEVVNDRHDVKSPPETTRDLPQMVAFDAAIQRPVTRALEVPRPRRALGVNALDDVPDSTWFTNRVGLTPDQVHNGPLTVDSPELHKPWTIVSNKSGGTEQGYIIHDARGLKYLIKFDRLGEPELETGSHVVVNRLLWAAGYNVPEDQIAWVRINELLLAKDAMALDSAGNPMHELRREDVYDVLAKVEHEPDGRIRVMASRWLDGKSLGRPPLEGVREGDRNDVIPHQLRRDLRGAFPIFAWVDHIDLVSGNFLDMWVTDPADPDRHYVKHYALDFGKSLGAMAQIARDPRRGVQYRIDVPQMSFGFVTLGLLPRPWEHHDVPRLRGVSEVFDAATFEPGAWKPDYPFVPFTASDRFDMYWGAKIVARFTPDQIRAAVEAGQFSDPRAVTYLVDTLVARQRKTTDYWFARVNPLDRFAMQLTGELCFDDLGITEAAAPTARTRYELATYDASGVALGKVLQLGAAPGGRTCTSPIPLTGHGDGYTIVKITTTRPGFEGSTFVHLARQTGAAATPKPDVAQAPITSTAQVSLTAEEPAPPIPHAPAVIGVWR